MLEQEYSYYQQNKKVLLPKYYHKYVVIQNESVFGAFDTEEEAIEAGMAKFALGTFLVQLVTEEEEVKHFFSRVLFQ